MTDPMRYSRPIVEDRSGGVCERCGVARATEKHHRKLRRHGDHRAANLVDLCTPCHAWVHANPAAAYESGFMVRAASNPRTVPVRHARRGWVQLIDSGATKQVVRTEGVEP